MGQVASVPTHAVDELQNSAVDAFVPRRDVWVQLRNAPADDAEEQALLVCELQSDEWIAWVPGYGELHLNRSQFHRIGAIE